MEQDRVVLAPHLGSATTDTRMRMAQMCVASITAFLEGAESVPHRLV
jgi:lactate dehydrogenase-like 2-hydroxyacid dehydrogenase